MAQGQYSLSDAQPVAGTGAYSLTDAQPVQQEQPGAVSRFFAPLNPMPLVRQLLKPPDDPKEHPTITAVKNIVGVVKDLGMAQVDMGKKAIKAYQDGDYIEAGAKGLSALVPILGPMSQQAADKFSSGDVAGGMGTLTAMAGPEALDRLPGAARATVDAGTAVKDVVTNPAFKAKVLSGGAKVAGGAGAAAAGHPYLGFGMAARGAGDVVQGVRDALDNPQLTPGESVSFSTEVPKPAAVPEIPKLYNDLAINYAGAPYAKLPPEGQAAIKSLADRMATPIQPDAAIVPKAPRSMADYGVQPTGTAGGPTGGEVSPASAEIPQPVQSPAQQVQSSTPKSLSKMKASEVSQRMVDKLAEWDFSPDEAKSMNADSWTRLAKEAGIIDPVKSGAKVTYNLTDAMYRRVIEGLQHKLAGPPITKEALMDKLKASLGPTQ